MAHYWRWKKKSPPELGSAERAVASSSIFGIIWDLGKISVLWGTGNRTVCAERTYQNLIYHARKHGRVDGLWAVGRPRTSAKFNECILKLFGGTACFFPSTPQRVTQQICMVMGLDRLVGSVKFCWTFCRLVLLLEVDSSRKVELSAVITLVIQEVDKLGKIQWASKSCIVSCRNAPSIKNNV